MFAQRVEIKVRMTSAWLAIPVLILCVVAFYYVAVTVADVELCLNLIFLAIIVSVAYYFAFVAERLAINRWGIEYTRWPIRKAMSWRSVRRVEFVVRDAPSFDEPGFMTDFNATTFDAEDLRGHAYFPHDREWDPIALMSPPPDFRCSIKFIGDGEIGLRTRRFQGPTLQDYLKALIFVRAMQNSYQFEVGQVEHGESR